MTGTQELIIEVPDNEWLTENKDPNRYAKARARKALRQRGYMYARSQKLTPMSRAFCTVYVKGRTGGRLDPANAEPTVKPIIDGLVDAGALPDDDSEHLKVAFDRDPGRHRRGFRQLRFVFVEQEVPF